MSLYDGFLNDNEKALLGDISKGRSSNMKQDLVNVTYMEELNGVGSFPSWYKPKEEPRPKCETKICKICQHRMSLPVDSDRCTWCRDKAESLVWAMELAEARGYLETLIGHEIPDNHIQKYVRMMEKMRNQDDGASYTYDGKDVFKSWMREFGYNWDYKGEK